MELHVTGRYSSSLGSYEPGQVLSLTDEEAELLLRDSPGSFTRAGAGVRPSPAPAAPASEFDADAEPTDEDDFDPTGGAMSTETATGLVVPDRRARGGRRRAE